MQLAFASLENRTRMTTHQVVEEVMRGRAAAHPVLHQLLAVHQERLDGLHCSGDVSEVDTEPVDLVKEHDRSGGGGWTCM